MQRLAALEVDSDATVPRGWQEKLKRQQEQLKRQKLDAMRQALSGQINAFKQALPKRAVAVKAGCYQMGEGGDAHEICVDAFKIGKYEVTFAEYDLFCDVTGRDKPSDEGWGRGDRPVINVSWDDAVAYAEWVSDVTRRRFRLPTEAEWEYAARAGTTTAYWWGDEIGLNRANCDGCGSQWDRSQTAPAGSFPANPWGLHDTAGNVWEWVCSAYGDYDGRREKTCLSKKDANGRNLVLRGGAWHDGPEWLRSGNRNGTDAANRNYNLGFRLAQD